MKARCPDKSLCHLGSPGEIIMREHDTPGGARAPASVDQGAALVDRDAAQSFIKLVVWQGLQEDVSE